VHAHTGSVTLILRFGSALNLNIHFYMLFLDGVYVDSAGHSDQQRTQSTQPYHGSAGQAAGVSLHAAVAAKAQQRDKLECLCRYITRPAVSEKRLSH
jgi:hypothetical protein